MWAKLTKRVRERDGHRCRSCGCSTPPRFGAVDHVVPLYLGGSSSVSNLVLLCDDCHRAKTRTESADARRRAAAR
jgi:5-methylcytosine-specific restriction endonuclease McrA